MKTATTTTKSTKMMMNDSILGIGNDIVEIHRIHESIAQYGERFLERLFTAEERAYCSKHQDPVPHFAGRFSAKEAIVKALGVGFGKEVGWHDIEILNDAHGKPVVTFSPAAAARLSNPKVLVSISHCKLYATAVAIQLGKGST
jgi:holo-[acyl-carrier protein] synthase